MLRLATFNVENLFDRPKIINMEDTSKSSKLLKAADLLQKELQKATYDKARIELLLTELKGYVTIRQDRGKFFVGRSRTKVKANGKDDWDGAIEFTRTSFGDKQRANTAKFIKSLNADVMCLIEVEGRQTLSDFMREFIQPKAQRLDRNMLIDSPIDPRGIDIAVAWKQAELGTIRSNVYDQRTIAGKVRSVWSRDCLEVELQLAGGKSLWVIANHFKSKFGGDTPDSIAKRTAQSERLAQILTTRYNLKKDLVAVMGDLNDTPDSTPIQPLYAVPKLFDAFDVANLPATDRWTYYYQRNPVAKRCTQIDYVFVSDALRKLVKNVEVVRTGMSAVAEGKIPGLSPMPGVTGWKDAASDHAAICVDVDGLDLP
jgi:predicted extracellular nuclease